MSTTNKKKENKKFLSMEEEKPQEQEKKSKVDSEAKNENLNEKAAAEESVDSEEIQEEGESANVDEEAQEEESEEEKDNNEGPEDVLRQMEEDVNQAESEVMKLCNEQAELLLAETKESDIQLTVVETKLARMRKLLVARRDIMSIAQKRFNRINQKEVAPVKARSSKIVVPSGLPKFRQGSQHGEPVEFLEAFKKVMDAHEIPEERFIKLLPLCLDNVDGQWLKTVNQNAKWNAIYALFIGHFQHPNANILWQEQIRKLKMDGSGVQRYTDQFVSLAHKLGWNLNGNEAIYQYKVGLPDWLNDSLASAEAAAMVTGSKAPGVETLGNMALRIEASRRGPKIGSNEAKKMSDNKCGFCGRKGHKEDGCYIKNPNLKKEFKKPVQTGGDKKVEDKKVSNHVEERQFFQSRRCYICGKEGHSKWKCPNKKPESEKPESSVKTFTVDKNSEERNKKFQEYTSVNNLLEVPCVLNNEKVIGLLDTGANVSIIHKELVDKKRWKIDPKSGTITQAMEGKPQPRIGVVSDVSIEVGDRKIKATLEVAKLSGSVDFIIGMDLFNQLGFKLQNVPFTWPKTEELKKPKPMEEVSRKEKLPEGVDPDGIAQEWRKIIQDNVAIPIDSTCKLPDSVLSINTGDSKPSWIRQYTKEYQNGRRMDGSLKHQRIVSGIHPFWQQTNLQRRKENQMISDFVWMQDS
jgi:hypothetical protein